MTSQTKRFIELSDIIGLRVQCRNPKCEASLLIGDAQIMALAQDNDSTLYKCPACRSGWTIPATENLGYPGSERGYDKEIKTFLRMLINMRAFESKVGCHLMLEIKEETSAK